jgi:hypothetical protein
MTGCIQVRHTPCSFANRVDARPVCSTTPSINNSLFSHRSAVIFSRNKPAASNQEVILSELISTNHQSNEKWWLAPPQLASLASTSRQAPTVADGDGEDSRRRRSL